MKRIIDYFFGQEKNADWKLVALDLNRELIEAREENRILYQRIADLEKLLEVQKMTEPNILSQILGILASVVCLFAILVLIANSEQKARRRKEEQERLDQAIIEVYQQGRNQFNNIARQNIRNCDRQFTYDTQAPVGLRPDLLALPQPKEQQK